MKPNDRIKLVLGAMLVMGAIAIVSTHIPVVRAAANWALSRTGSTVAIVSDGQINITPKSGKTTVVTRSIALNGGATVPTGQTIALTDADSLTVNSVIVPQNVYLNWTAIGASNLSGDFMFQAPRALQVTAIRIVQRAQGGSGCVIDVEKLTGTTAPGSGTVMGTASYNCNSTANNTVTTYTLTGTTGTLQLAAGDRVGVKLGGTLTSLAGATVTVTFKAI